MMVETSNSIMGQNIYYLRRKKRISREKFANMVGMNRYMLSFLEKGEINAIDGEAPLNICNLFNVKVEVLLSEDLRKK